MCSNFKYALSTWICTMQLLQIISKIENYDVGLITHLKIYFYGIWSNSWAYFCYWFTYMKLFTLCEFHWVLKIALTDEETAMYYYTEKSWKVHLWDKSSKQMFYKCFVIGRTSVKIYICRMIYISIDHGVKLKCNVKYYIGRYLTVPSCIILK